MIRKATGALLRPPLTAIQTFEQARAAQAASAPGPQDDIPPDVARAVIHAHMDRHYRETLDQPIPALKGKTPRHSVKTAAGRGWSRTGCGFWKAAAQAPRLAQWPDMISGGYGQSWG
jgi:hypothetical protein